uniref:Uncharacterized protein LOC105117190 n=1 Tax=Rhizophora mucronata TaxID=61149 RepID=A0A2P2QWH4_RHIMU
MRTTAISGSVQKSHLLACSLPLSLSHTREKAHPQRDEGWDLLIKPHNSH